MGVTKEDFFKYVGEDNSLSGYSRSYKNILKMQMNVFMNSYRMPKLSMRYS